MAKRKPKMTNADFARRVALITRISAQYSHELVYGMRNPHFCAADAGAPVRYFIEEIEQHMDVLRAALKQQSPPEAAQARDAFFAHEPDDKPPTPLQDRMQSGGGTLAADPLEQRGENAK